MCSKGVPSLALTEGVLLLYLVPFKGRLEQNFCEPETYVHFEELILLRLRIPIKSDSKSNIVGYDMTCYKHLESDLSRVVRDLAESVNSI